MTPAVPERREIGSSRLTDDERELLRQLGRTQDRAAAAGALGISTDAFDLRLRETESRLGIEATRQAVRRLVEFDAQDAEPARAAARRSAQHRIGLYFLIGLVVLAILVGAFEVWLTSRG